MDAFLTNGRIITSDADDTVADAVAVLDGRVAFVGRAEDHSPAPGSRLIDLGGRTVLTGLIDAHTHPTMVARSAWHISLPDTDDLEEILSFVKEYGETHSPDEAPFLYFEYYPSTLFGESGPTKEMLDAAISDRPVLLQDFSDHAHWVNSRMIDLLGVTRETPDPVPGLEMFVRDADGEPTGYILEMAYEHFIDRMYDAIDWRPPSVTAESMSAVLDRMSANGVTSLFEALIEDEDALAAIAALDRQGASADDLRGGRHASAPGATSTTPSPPRAAWTARTAATASASAPSSSSSTGRTRAATAPSSPRSTTTRHTRTSVRYRWMPRSSRNAC